MSKIEQQVMASVGVIYTARQLMGATALKVYALGASGIALWQFTWVHRVIENLANVGLENALGFVTYAVLHTHLATQAAFIVALAAGISLTIDAIRTLLRPSQSLSLLG